ncbi:hypothetical protein SASPL_133362 [Salvia splendens]|uniref:Protein kinase domain-containing protein n=1 Tax=Salvia splendens TaxID=180675 RepID=A0A8X8X4Y2_SALSN|nr:hypothetical protein SASPL_133362 [Salvia splendens]
MKILCLTLELWECSVEALNSFKREILEDPSHVLSNWNFLDSDPCGWPFIACSVGGDHVIKLNVSGKSLKGFITAGLYQLSGLQELILHGNLLIGAIPKEIGMLKNLKVFDLGSNQLTGAIPPEIGNISSIVKINLQSNGLVGKLPPELGNLEYVEELRLDRNKLGGILPATSSDSILDTRGMTSLPSRQRREAPISCTLCLCYVTQSTCLQQRWKKRHSVMIPWKNAKDNISIYIDFSNIIGSSPDSLVYKGTMKGGPEIAVISLCIKEDQWSGDLELSFQKEVAGLARLNHENVGKLLGYCMESKPFTRMLVFYYASNGTLYEHLHYGEACQFSWTRRMRILIGIARGLKYLHAELDLPFTISNMNSSSIYLTDEFSPKLVDFECWKTVLSRSEKSSGTISNEAAVCILPNSLYSAKEYLYSPEVISQVVDPELKSISETRI